MTFRTGTETEMKEVAHAVFADTYPIVIDDILVCNLLGQTCDNYYMRFLEYPEPYVREVLLTLGDGNLQKGMKIIIEEYPEYDLDWAIKNRIVERTAEFTNNHYQDEDFKSKYNNLDNYVKSMELRNDLHPVYSKDYTKMQSTRVLTEEEKNERLRSEIVSAFSG